MFSIADATTTTIGSLPLWGGFAVFVCFMLALDLGVFNRKAHAVTFRESLAWSLVWISLSLVFGGGIFRFYGPELGAEFIAAWLIEKALSVDNLFVFLVIFRTFQTPPAQQHRALFWGVIGAVVFRGLFIFGGTALLTQFKVAVYLLGGFLVFTGVKILLVKDDGTEEENAVTRFFRKRLGENPASFIVLIAIVEVSDIIFAIDSIPAVLAISKDPFIVVTSNIFAILGLRSLFFLLAGALDKIRYLKTGLAVILVFVGGKMIAADTFHVPIAASLGVIVAILGVTVIASLLRPPVEEKPDGGPEEKPTP